MLALVDEHRVGVPLAREAFDRLAHRVGDGEISVDLERAHAVGGDRRPAAALLEHAEDVGTSIQTAVDESRDDLLAHEGVAAARDERDRDAR